MPGRTESNCGCDMGPAVRGPWLWTRCGSPDIWRSTGPSRTGLRPEEALRLLRGHWRIGSQRFHVKDNSFREDRRALGRHNSGAVLSLLSNAALCLLRGEGKMWRSKEPLSGRSRRLCARPSSILPPNVPLWKGPVARFDAIAIGVSLNLIFPVSSQPSQRPFLITSPRPGTCGLGLSRSLQRQGLPAPASPRRRADNCWSSRISQLRPARQGHR